VVRFGVLSGGGKGGVGEDDEDDEDDAFLLLPHLFFPRLNNPRIYLSFFFTIDIYHTSR